MAEPTVVVTKGSGTGLSFGSQSGTGLYTPSTRDRTSLTQNLSDGSWVETQPDGLQLIYKPVNVTPGTYSNSGWGYAQNLLGHGYLLPHFGAPASGPLSSQANQPAWLTLDRESSYGPPPGSSYSADGMGSPLDRAAGAVPETPWLSLPLGSPCGGGGAGNAAPSGASCTNPSASATIPSTNGNLPGASYQVNLGNGNLVVSLGTPSAGSSDPPVKFFYNSLAVATQASEYGAGWTGLYRQRVDGATTAAWLGAIVNPASQRWTLTRDTTSRVKAIVDPLLRRTTFAYTGSALSSVTDSGGRSTSFNVNGSGNLVRVIPPGSAPVTMVYNASHLLTAWVNPLLDRTSFIYDGSGRVTRITSPNNQSTTFAYLTGRTRVTDPRGNLWTLTLDGSGDVLQALDSQGIVTSYTWDTLQKLLSFRDGRGYRTTYTYSSMADNSARLAGVQRPIGQWQFAYSSSTGKLASLTDPNSNRSTLTWDGSGNRSTLTNALSQQYAYKYSTLGQMTAAADPLGHRISYAYDVNARRSAEANALNQRTSFAFNSSGQVSSVTDPLNHVSNTKFDSSDKLLSMTDANGNTTTQVYDPNGRQVARINPLNSRWTSVYDPGGRLVAAIDPNLHRTSYAYDLNSNSIRTQDARGFITTQVFDKINRQIATVDALLERTSFAYDSSHNRIRTTNALGNIWSATFDGNRRQTAGIDPLGNRTSYAYDNAGDNTSVTDPLGDTAATEYDALLRAKASIDPLGNRTSLTFDAASRQVRSTNPLGNISTAVFDNANRQIASITPLGFRSSMVYDAAGRNTATVDPLGNRTSSVYDPGNRLTARIDPLANRTSMTYNQADWQVRSTNPLNNSTTTVYDKTGLRLATVTPLGNRTSYAYDADNNPIRATDPLNDITTQVYDALDRSFVTITPLGNRTTLAFDRAGRQVRSTNPLNNSTTAVYDIANRRIASVTPLGFRSSMGYDAASRQTSTTDPLGNTASSVYDADSRLIASVTPLGFRTSYAYDKASRRVRLTNPLNNSTTTLYDPDDRQVATVDPLLNRTSSVYDAASRRIASINALGNRTSYLYDKDSRNTCLLDANGHRASFGYDAASRQVFTEDADARRTTFGYDLDDRKTLVVNARSRRLSLVYDNAARLTIQKHQDGTRFSYTYDKESNRTLVQDSSGRTTYAYDVDRRLASQRDPSTSIMTFTYDADDRLTVRNLSVSGRCSFSYDKAARLTLQVNPQGQRTSSSYDNDSRRTQQVLANGITVSQIFDAGARLTRRAAIGSSGLINEFDYTYNAANLPVQVKELDGGVTTWTYDAAYELTSQDRTSTLTGSDYQSTIKYDPAANPVQEIASVTTSTYDPANQLMLMVSGLARTTNTFDANGYPTTQAAGAGTTALTWNDDYRLIQAVLPNGNVVTQTYNADGLRLVTQDQSGTTQYIYHGSTLVAETDGSNTPLTVYTQAPGTSGGLISRYDPGTASTDYPIYDGQGSVDAITNQLQAVTAQSAYDAYGDILVMGDPTLEYNAQSGYYYDSDLGLYLVGQRWYNSGIKLWLSPALISPLTDTGIYIYSGNNPVTPLRPVSPCATPTPTSPTPSPTPRPRPCTCISAALTFDPGGGSPRWGEYNSAGADRIGFKIISTYRYRGDPTGCHFYQDETGTFDVTYLPNFNVQDPNDHYDPQTTVAKQNNEQTVALGLQAGSGMATYTDPLGTNVPARKTGTASLELKDYTVIIRCVSSNGDTQSSQHFRIVGKTTFTRKSTGSGGQSSWDPPAPQASVLLRPP